jgi:hypothetical protein
MKCNQTNGIQYILVYARALPHQGTETSRKHSNIQEMPMSYLMNIHGQVHQANHHIFVLIQCHMIV